MEAILQQQLDCPLVADYTETDVPVTIALDEVNSILNPGPGEFQTFCYIVTQVEEPTALSHFVLEICPDITEADLEDVTVFINDVEQDVTIGDNVEIFNPPDTDPTTGVSGLKIDFGLEDAGDVMRVCFSLTDVYLVGPVEAVIKGGQFVGTGEFVCGPVCGEVPSGCDTTVYQTIDVCVPVTVTASAEIISPISVICCGDVNISDTPCNPEGDTEITFYVRRRVCAIIPIDIEVDAVGGDAALELVDTSLEECLECDQNGNGVGTVEM